MSFEANENVDAMQLIGVLFSAIVNKQVLLVSYEPFGKPMRTYAINPYYLKQYNRRWFLFGLTKNGEYENISNLALDRITNIEFLPDKYIESNLDWTEYFEDLLGVTISDEPVEKIVLEFVASRLPYVISKPLHPTQRHDKESDLISIEVKPTKELYQRLLSFGADVKVLSPESVRLKMQKEIEKMWGNYIPVQNHCTPKQ